MNRPSAGSGSGEGALRHCQGSTSRKQKTMRRRQAGGGSPATMRFTRAAGDAVRQRGSQTRCGDKVPNAGSRPSAAAYPLPPVLVRNGGGASVVRKRSSKIWGRGGGRWLLRSPMWLDQTLQLMAPCGMRAPPPASRAGTSRNHSNKSQRSITLLKLRADWRGWSL